MYACFIEIKSNGFNIVKLKVVSLKYVILIVL